jgi:4-hydroxy-3-polyprenylbenzoate decarboxylase
MLAASKERYALAVGLDPKLSTTEMIAATRDLLRRRIAPVHVSKGDAPVNEVVLRGDQIDLTTFPIPKFWPNDGGTFIGTGTVTFTKSPTSDRINVGSYRQALHSADRVGLNCVPGRHGILDCEAWWAQGKPCEIVAAYGIDPVLLIAGSQGLGRDESELDFAGGLMGHPFELTEAEFVSLPIPARAEFVIEGLAHPGDVEMEGPLGEFHGFYSGDRAAKPVIQVKAVHYRRSPIMTASLMATYPACEMGAYHCIIRSARIHDSLVQNGMTGIRGVYVHPAAASGMCMAVVSLKQMRPGHAAQALALTAQCTAAPYLKWIIAVDEDVDPTDFDQVIWALSTRCNPSDDLDILRNTWTYRSDPSLAPEVRPYGSKVLVNACAPHRYLKQAPRRTLIRREIYDRVSDRWSELGLPGAPPNIKNFHSE